MSAKTREALLATQRRWATADNKTFDRRGYLGSYLDNLWRPLSAVGKECFDRGSGSELRDGKTRPAKMKALHSSSALAANVFDYWGDRDLAPLMEALDAEAAAERPRFEVQFPTGLRGEPPNLDVVIKLASGSTLAIESKFCEWITPKSKSTPPFKNKYFSPRDNLWRRVGLHASQRLANDIHSKAEPFVHLDAPQLLKHALGLATNLGATFHLWYLYYDWPSPEADAHRKEILRFASRAGSELRFRATTYQELFGRLRQRCTDRDREYVTYLEKRYFHRV